MLIGDPPVPDPRDTTRLDPSVFRGPAMTYYGRWTYKYDVAAERGAAAVLLVHQTVPAGYPWSVVQSNDRERFEVEGGPRHAPVEGWIQLEAARALFAAGGHDFAALERARPHPRASARSRSAARRASACTTPSAACSRATSWRASTAPTPPCATRACSSPRTGTASASAGRSTATPSTTARWTTRRAWRGCWRLAGAFRSMTPPRGARWSSSPSRRRSRGCWAPAGTPRIPSCRWTKTLADINMDA